MMSTASRHAHVLRLAAAAARPQPSLPRCPQASAALEHAPGLKSTHPLKVADEVGMALSGARDLVREAPGQGSADRRIALDCGSSVQCSERAPGRIHTP